MREIEGKVVLVTGGGRGLGEAICHALAAAGANVIVADIRQDLADEATLKSTLAMAWRNVVPVRLRTTFDDRSPSPTTEHRSAGRKADDLAPISNVGPFASAEPWTFVADGYEESTRPFL